MPHDRRFGGSVEPIFPRLGNEAEKSCPENRPVRSPGSRDRLRVFAGLRDYAIPVERTPVVRIALGRLLAPALFLGMAIVLLAAVSSCKKSSSRGGSPVAPVVPVEFIFVADDRFVAAGGICDFPMMFPGCAISGSEYPDAPFADFDAEVIAWAVAWQISTVTPDVMTAEGHVSSAGGSMSAGTSEFAITFEVDRTGTIYLSGRLEGALDGSAVVELLADGIPVQGFDASSVTPDATGLRALDYSTSLSVTPGVGYRIRVTSMAVTFPSTSHFQCRLGTEP